MFIMAGWTGCDLINPDETLPTTIHLEPFTFNALSGQGSSSNKITETWVYANGSFLGAFNPPVDVRYLGTGSTRFVFRPGIRNNGIASDAIVYPLFTGDTFQLEASPGATFTVSPHTGYVPEAVFGLIADFELNNPFTDNRDTVSASKLVRSTTDVYEGEYAGEIVMSQEAYFIEVAHVVPISDIPTNGNPVYLEFRYKSEVELAVGLYGIELNGTSASRIFYLAKASPDWNMLYIELTDQVVLSSFDSYKIIFQAFYKTTGPAEQHIFLDNIKVVYLPE
jgi:hypothetical protein